MPTVPFTPRSGNYLVLHNAGDGPLLGTPMPANLSFWRVLLRLVPASARPQPSSPRRSWA
jgi:hypothetical protein